MDLIPNINEEETIANVKTFFFNEKYYPTIRRRSGDWGLKSPQMDVTGIPASGGGNHNEEKYLDVAHYRQAKRAVEYAIAGCKQRSQQILKYEYQQQLPIVECKELVGLYGHDTYQHADRYACFEFADTISVARVLFFVTDLIPELQDQEENRK